MRSITVYFIASLAFNSSLYAQPPATADPWAPGETIYRHYTGTIGNKKAALDLRYDFVDAANFGGSTCYFTNEGSLDFFLIAKPNSARHTETLRATVFPEHLALSEVQNAYSIYVQTPRFDFTLSHDSLTGKWYNPNAQEQLTIVMTEDNSAGIEREITHAVDSAFATNKKGARVQASATYTGIGLSEKMNAKERAFITRAFAQFMGGEKASARESAEFAQICFRKFFADFSSAAGKDDDLDGSNFSGNYTVFPVFSEKGFLVLQKGGFQYDFGNKEYTDANTYLCLDVTNRKTLQLQDVLDVNNELLTSLLEKAFRKKYQLDADKKLSDLLTSGDRMPLTDNFILLNTGLVFSYSPTKIFRGSEDISELQEMRLFLSYDELASMLKPEFKMRMALQ